MGLARSAMLLDVPIVATATLTRRFGPLFPELAELLSNAEVIERTKINPFDDPRIVSAIEQAGRTNLIIAGVFISVCTCFPAMSAREAGYGAYAAFDASAALDEPERRTAILRMTQAGVIVANYSALVIEMLADNADPKAAEVYGAIASQYGVSSMAALYEATTAE